MLHGLTGTPLARLILTVTVIEENGELFWESEIKTTMLRLGDIRNYNFQLTQNGIRDLENFLVFEEKDIANQQREQAPLPSSLAVDPGDDPAASGL